MTELLYACFYFPCPVLSRLGLEESVIVCVNGNFVMSGHAPIKALTLVELAVFGGRTEKEILLSSSAVLFRR